MSERGSSRAAPEDGAFGQNVFPAFSSEKITLQQMCVSREKIRSCSIDENCDNCKLQKTSHKTVEEHFQLKLLLLQVTPSSVCEIT